MKNTHINILLVEDDEIDAMNVRRAFKKININNPLHRATNGIEALNMLRGENGATKLDPMPRLVLLDLNMPQMNGIEFLQEIRRDPVLKTLVVVVLTTSNDEKDKVSAYDFNVAGYILKPVEPQDFMQAVASLGLYWNLIELP